MKEFWKQYRATRYEVSTLGRVRIAPRKNGRGRVIEPGVVLKSQIRVNNLEYISMVIDGKKTTKPVHLIVAEVFLKKPEGATRVVFKNGLVDAPHRKNIKWEVPEKRKEDTKGSAYKKYKRGMNHWSNTRRENQLTDKDVEIIKRSNQSVSELSTLFGISRTHIYRIKNGQSRALPTPYKNSLLEQKQKHDET